MIKSMTGYGKAEVVVANGRLIAEIRSVNHRYGEISVKLPRALMAFENDVRKCVGSRLKRGKIEVFVQQEGSVGREVLPAVNLPVARAYYEAFSRLKGNSGLPIKLPWHWLLPKRMSCVSAEVRRKPSLSMVLFWPPSALPLSSSKQCGCERGQFSMGTCWHGGRISLP